MREVKKIETVVLPSQSPEKRRVAVYARVSSGKDAMLNSLSAQVSYFSEFIQNHPGWEYSGVYVDEAVTGTNDNRPQFQQMLEECRAGNIDMIVTKAISRFARNTVTSLETIRELKAIGVDVFFKQQNIHTLSSRGEMMLTILSAIAQEESRSVSENCKWRIRKDFEKGRPTVRKVYGFTQQDRKYIPQPDEAEIVKMIYDDYLSGMGSEAIMKKLRSMGIRFSRNRVLYLLKSEKYVGDLLLQKKHKKDHITKKTCINDGVLPMYYVKNSHESIIDRATHERVQEEIQRRNEHYHPTRQEQRTYAFTGMIRCGTCGATFRRKTVGQKDKKPVWICSTYNTEGKAACASQQIPEAILEAKCAEALGIPAFDEAVFKQNIQEIQVPAHNRLVFHFMDGSIQTLDWQNPSRRDSWTPEMKEQARRKTNERNASICP